MALKAAAVTALAVTVPLLLSGCADGFGTAPSVVVRPRLLTVVAEPPEARPGEPVKLRAVVGAPPKFFEQPLSLRWAFCSTAPRPGSTAAVNPSCRDREGTVAISGDQLVVTAEVPRDACRRFGPDTPPGDFRPQDPDSTGGFYQPIRIVAFGELWFHFLRLRCPLADAPADASRRFATEYENNENPEPTELRLGQQTRLDLAPTAENDALVLTAGTSLPLELAWTPESSEDYLWFDAASRDLKTRNESLSVTWFATAGELSTSRATFAENANANTQENRWTLPAQPGPAYLWAVLRDSRGGNAVARATVEVAR